MWSLSVWFTLVWWLTATHSYQNIRFIRAEAVPKYSPRNKDHSASGCNTRFSTEMATKRQNLQTAALTCKRFQSSSKWFNLEQRAARTAYNYKNLQYSNTKKCARLLRPWRDAKHFSTSKTVFTKMIHLSMRTFYDQICTYTHFINEAHGFPRLWCFARPLLQMASVIVCLWVIVSLSLSFNKIDSIIAEYTTFFHWVAFALCFGTSSICSAVQ